MTDDKAAQAAHHLRIANGLLEQHGLSGSETLEAGLDPASLLQSAQSLLADAPVCPRPVVRSLHHMACSGGTMIAGVIAGQTNVRLLSELNPFSTQTDLKHLFRPSDVSFQARHGVRPVTQRTVHRLFVAEIDVLLQDAHENGFYLVLRDHSHSAYCLGIGPQDGPPLVEILRDAFPTRPLVTVRHPLDCYLGLLANGWLHFEPRSLGEYCKRVALFLDDHSHAPLQRYEDMFADPEAWFEQACGFLELNFGADVLVPDHRKISVSGGSGRQSSAIAARPRRPVPAYLRAQASDTDYCALCDRLGYDPDPNATPIKGAQPARPTSG